jgi:hypothetical protein
LTFDRSCRIGVRPVAHFGRRLQPQPNPPRRVRPTLADDEHGALLPRMQPWDWSYYHARPALALEGHEGRRQRIPIGRPGRPSLPGHEEELQGGTSLGLRRHLSRVVRNGHGCLLCVFYCSEIYLSSCFGRSDGLSLTTILLSFLSFLSLFPNFLLALQTRDIRTFLGTVSSSLSSSRWSSSHSSPSSLPSPVNRSLCEYQTPFVRPSRIPCLTIFLTCFTQVDAHADARSGRQARQHPGKHGESLSRLRQ